MYLLADDNGAVDVAAGEDGLCSCGYPSPFLMKMKDFFSQFIFYRGKTQPLESTHYCQRPGNSMVNPDACRACWYREARHAGRPVRCARHVLLLLFLILIEVV
jgi:hypothetical protein